MNWRKARVVAVFELLSTVRSKSFLITTFGMPVFLSLYGLLVAIPGLMEVQRRGEVRVYAVVDRAGVLDLAGEVAGRPEEIPQEIRDALGQLGQAETLDAALAIRGSVIFRPVEERDEAREAVQAKAVTGAYILPTDYLETGRVELLVREDAGRRARKDRDAFRGLVLDRLLAGRLPEAEAGRVRQPMADLQELALAADGQERARSVWGGLVRILLPLAFAILLMLSLIMTAGGLLQATGVEKENRVVEVLLAAASPVEILAGKLLGVGATGLLQVVVWFGMLGVMGVVMAGTLAGLGVELPWPALAIAPALFVATYFFLGSLILGTGSLGTNARESQQLGMLWSVPLVAPLIFFEVILEDPGGTIARVLSWIPFTAPVTVLMRLSVAPESIAWWEVAGILAVLVAATWGSLLLAARLFRIGLMLTGSRPKLRALLRQARLGA